MKNIKINILALVLLTSMSVFASSGKAIKKDAGNCPNKPGCICVKPSTTATATVPVKDKAVVTKEKDNCPNKPGCICPKK